MSHHSLPKVRQTGAGLTLVLSFLALAWVTLHTPLSPFDGWAFDHYLRWRGSRAPALDSRIVVVGVDDSDLKNWPGIRQEIEGLSRILRQSQRQGARVSALDPLVYRGEDQDFSSLWAVLQEPGAVVLGRTFHHSTRLPQQLKLPEGLVYVNSDEDGRLRSYLLARHDSNSSASLPSLALAAYLRYQNLSWSESLFDEQNALKWSEFGQDRSFPNSIWLDLRADWTNPVLTPSQLNAWESQGLSGQLEGKIVLVGYLAHGTTDLVSTVFRRTTPKVFIHAQALNGLLQNAWFAPAPPWLAGLVVCLLIGLGVRLGSRGGPRAWILALGGNAVIGLASIGLLAATHCIPWMSTWMVFWTLAVVLSAWHQEQLRNARMAAIQVLADGEDPWLLKRLGPYQTVRKLGVGGFASVYQAVPQDSLDPEQSVALKIVHPAQTEDPKFRQRFLREVRISSHLQHPNIVKVFTWGEGESRLFMAMELIQGNPLKHYLECGRRWSESETLQVLRLLLKALEYAHQNHVLHRDLKPDNIMIKLDREEQPWQVLALKVVDFGLAFDDEAARITRTDEVLGTLDYLAPERLQGKADDPRSDLYAVGVIVYEMLAGTSPFQQKGAGEAILYRLTQDPPALADLEMGISPHLSGLVARLMQRDPEQRYASAAAVLQELPPGPS